jgi:hypothetical protein
MEKAFIRTHYLGVEGEIEGLKCPICYASYIMEETAVGKLARAERSVEEK